MLEAEIIQRKSMNPNSEKSELEKQLIRMVEGKLRVYACSKSQMLALFKSLRSRLFFFLWVGQAFSRFGDSIYRIVLAWWVMEKTGSATAFGTVLVLSLVPMLVFSLAGGVTVDRVPRVRVLLTSDLLRGAIVGFVAALGFADLLVIWHVYAASALFGVVDAFFQPAYTALIPDVVPSDFVPSANALTSLTKQGANIAGPIIGALIVTRYDAAVGFAIDGFSFILSAVCLLPLLKLSGLGHIKQPLSTVFRDLSEGIRLVLQSPWLRITIALAAIGNITINGPISVAMPALIRSHASGDAVSLGTVYSMVALGAALGSILVGSSAGIRRRGLIVYGAWITGGFMLSVLGLQISIVGLYLAALAAAGALTISNLVWTHTLQELVPRQMLGRVSSIDDFAAYSLIPVGYIVTGWATDRVGAATVFLVGGAITAGLAALGLTNRAIRTLE